MRLVHKILKYMIDLLLLSAGLLYLYLTATPADSAGLMVADGVTIILIVFGLYLVIVGFVSLCLTYMVANSWTANLVKSIVTTIMVVALLDWLLIPILFYFFGLNLGADVRTVLIIVSVARTLLKIWLGRRWGIAGGGE